MHGVDSNLTAIVVLGTLLHVVVLAVMIWIRVRRTDSPLGSPVRVTPCAVCGEPAAGWTYDGLDPNEQINPETGRAWSPDLSHYRPLCANH